MWSVWLCFLWRSDVWLWYCLMSVLTLLWMMQSVQMCFPLLSVCVCRFPWFRLCPGFFLCRWNDLLCSYCLPCSMKSIFFLLCFKNPIHAGFRISIIAYFFKKEMAFFPFYIFSKTCYYNYY